jgi:hypothetical protein
MPRRDLCELRCGGEYQIGAGHEEDRDDAGDGKAAEDGAGKRRVLFAACFQRERHGNEAEHSGECRHQDWSQTHLAGGNDGVFELVALARGVGR